MVDSTPTDSAASRARAALTAASLADGVVMASSLLHRVRKSAYLVEVNLVVLPTPEAACVRAADIVAELLAARPGAVMALPAGNTPRPVYAELVRRHRAQGLSFAEATAFTLDEYVGIAPGHPASFHSTMREELYRHVDLAPGRTHAPDAAAADLDDACRRYEGAIA